MYIELYLYTTITIKGMYWSWPFPDRGLVDDPPRAPESEPAWSSTRSQGTVREMSSFEKVVKNACKPKAAPPKTKVSLRLSRIYSNLHCPSCLSTSTQSSPPHGPRTAPFTMSAKLFLLAFENQTQSSVSLHRQTRQCADDNRCQVVFKALIVLHMMVRNGATDNVLQYLSSSDVLRLKNVAGGQWEGVRHTFLPDSHA